MVPPYLGVRVPVVKLGCAVQGVPVSDVLKVLRGRFGVSGIDEKASRRPTAGIDMKAVQNPTIRYRFTPAT